MRRAAAALARVGLAGLRARLSPRIVRRHEDAGLHRPRRWRRSRKLLLLDEPFAALDEITRNALGDDLLRLWREDGLTVMFVTHSVSESSYLSSRVLVMTPRPGPHRRRHRTCRPAATAAFRPPPSKPSAPSATRSDCDGGMKRARRHPLAAGWSPLLLLGAWEWAVAHWQVPPYVLPAPIGHRAAPSLDNFASADGSAGFHPHRHPGSFRRRLRRWVSPPPSPFPRAGSWSARSIPMP